MVKKIPTSPVDKVKTTKRKRSEDQLNTKDKTEILSNKLKSWISHIGADVASYQEALWDVLNKNKQRYYRVRNGRNQSDNSVVEWLRDIDVYVSSDSIPKSAIGIDSSSAAVVDALRLGKIPEEELNVWILDMCCAPGGKLLATISSIGRFPGGNRKWNVVGLDMVKRRLDVCKSLLKKELFDESNIKPKLYCMESQDFRELDGESVIGKFDRIILDVECTHEGSLRSVARTLKYWGISSLEERWTQENAERIVLNQKRLLRHAISLIKPGGIIVYSTCSLDNQQNELLISNVVQEFYDIRFYPVPINQCHCCSPTERMESWPIISSMPLLKQSCPDKYFYQFSKEEIKKCKNATSPVAVRFNPIDSTSDGLFIASIIKVL